MWKKTCEKKKILIRFTLVVISEAKESERQRQRQRQRDFAVWIIHCPWLLLVEEEFLRFPPVVLDFIFSMDVVVIVACCWLQVLSRNIQLFKRKGRSFDFCGGCEERVTTQWDGCIIIIIIIIIKNTKLFIQECSFAALVCGFQSQLCCVLVPGCVLRCGHHLLQHHLVQGK